MEGILKDCSSILRHFKCPTASDIVSVFEETGIDLEHLTVHRYRPLGWEQEIADIRNLRTVELLW